MLSGFRTCINRRAYLHPSLNMCAADCAGPPDNDGFKVPAAPGEHQALRQQRSSGSDVSLAPPQACAHPFAMSRMPSAPMLRPTGPTWKGQGTHPVRCSVMLAAAAAALSRQGPHYAQGHAPAAVPPALAFPPAATAAALAIRRWAGEGHEQLSLSAGLYQSARCCH